MPCFSSISSSSVHNCFPTCQSSMNRMAIQALEKMETRKFKAKVKSQREASCGASDSVSSSSTSDCAICLERYIDGEVMIFRNVVAFLLEKKKKVLHIGQTSRFSSPCQFSNIYSKTKWQADRLDEYAKPLLRNPGNLFSSLFILVDFSNVLMDLSQCCLHTHPFLSLPELLLSQCIWRLTLVAFFYSSFVVMCHAKKSTQQRIQGVWESQRKWQYKRLSGIKEFVCDDEEKQQKQGGKAEGGGWVTLLWVRYAFWLKAVLEGVGNVQVFDFETLCLSLKCWAY